MDTSLIVMSVDEDFLQLAKNSAIAQKIITEIDCNFFIFKILVKKIFTVSRRNAKQMV